VSNNNRNDHFMFVCLFNRQYEPTNPLQSSIVRLGHHENETYENSNVKVDSSLDKTNVASSPVKIDISVCLTLTLFNIDTFRCLLAFTTATIDSFICQ
jgi:hypothetical protein